MREKNRFNVVTELARPCCTLQLNFQLCGVLEGTRLQMAIPVLCSVEFANDYVN